MPRCIHALWILVVLASLGGCAGMKAFDPLTDDPAVADPAFPADSQDLTILSGGDRMSGRMFMAQGAGPHPTVVVARGMPDLLGSLDVAMALRRAGFNVLSFNYRGCWGSEGTFTLMHSFEDVNAAVGFLREEAHARQLRVDPGRIVLLGFSYGGPAVLKAAAADPRIRAVALIDGTDMRSDVDELKAHPQEAIAWMDSLLAVRLGSGKAVTDEIVSQADWWNPATAKEGLAGKHVLLVVASRGTGAEPVARPTMAEMFKDSARLTAVMLDADHGFSDRRIALTRTVLSWAQGLSF